MANEIQVRRVDETEIGRFRDAIGVVFAFDPHPDDLPVFAGGLELDRSMVAVDGEHFVATGGAFSYRLVVPGGALIPAAGLTLITVQPTHRRRGLLSRMIEMHFEDADQRGEVVSMLWASEASIYGRFGYGMAVGGRDLTIARAHGRFRTDVPAPSGTVHLYEPEAAEPLIRSEYQAATVDAGLPGSIERREADWERYFYDPEHRREGATRRHYAVYRVGDEVRGYVVYRLKSSWGGGGPDGTVQVHGLIAADGEAYAALWRYVFSIDLMVKVEAYNRPPHDPLYLLLDDPRRVEAAGYDGLWVRVLDVAAALSQRRYQVEDTLVVEVVDRSRPDSGGRFRLAGGPAGAECERTDAAADLVVATEHLGAAYLGSPRFAALGWLGLVEGSPEALARVDLMFGWHRPPEVSVHF
jgi:predicted acetyltransferase